MVRIKIKRSNVFLKRKRTKAQRKEMLKNLAKARKVLREKRK